MFSMLRNLFASKPAEATPAGAAEATGPTPDQPAGPIVTKHTMPNGLIDGKPVEYSLTHKCDGATVAIALELPEATGVTAFPSPYPATAVPMQKDGDLWVLELTGLKPGDEIDVHFVVEKDGQQADNATAKHKISLPAAPASAPEAAAPETAAAAAPETAAAAGEATPASAEKSADAGAPAEGEGSGSRHKMPNGLINDQAVEYTFTHAFADGVLSLRLDAGPGHTSATAFPSPHDPAAVAMKQEGDIWVAEIHGLKEGDDLDVHFVVECNGQQVDNSTARHRIAVGATSPAA